MDTLPVEPVFGLPARPQEQRWLVTDLRSADAVGIVGGEPKCCKSFLALDVAVAVASGTACPRRFSVPQPGRVLLYAAEGRSACRAQPPRWHLCRRLRIPLIVNADSTR
jgi:hypothetical protein